ncbi:MAG: hypothetical protein DRQ13_00175 [Ignavibacteriae bacterium]|nr:MAG: hypothetical protein DRQ13_00175 [Ignavibacteriota bacterium]
MEYFNKETVGDIAIEKVRLPKATLIEAKVFWERLQTAISQENDKLIIDLSDCTFVDSTFMGVIVQAQRELIKNQGELKLVLPAEQMKEFFKFAGITKVIETFQSKEDALSSFNKEPEIRDIVFT